MRFCKVCGNRLFRKQNKYCSEECTKKNTVVMDKDDYNAIISELESMYQAIGRNQPYQTIISYWDKHNIDYIIEEINKNNGID